MDVKGVQRVDHFGIVAGIIKELGLVEEIDRRVGVDSDEKVTTGEAIAAMIINGLGFTDRPLSLVPQFFETCPVELLFREKVRAEDFNRFKLGRALDKAYEYDCTLLFAELAKHVCRKEVINTNFVHLDTTSFSLTGEYLPDSDENAIKIVQGYSKDRRPDLKQTVLELMVTQDGGIPLLSKAWNGNASDNEVFQERAKALIDEFSKENNSKILYADSKLYNEKNAANLKEITFVTRIPDSINLVGDTIIEALKEPTINWHKFDESRRYRVFSVKHYEVEQRWIVVSSDVAEVRAKSTLAKRIQKEHGALEKELFHLQAKHFACAEDAQNAIKAEAKKWRYHSLADTNIVPRNHFSKKGRPKENSSPNKITYQIEAKIKPDKESINRLEEEHACFVLGTNASSDILSPEAVVSGYIQQQTVERGFRFLKDPLFFTSSLFVKKASRIEGLLMVMTFALLVYAVAERRLRQNLKSLEETLPNQIKQPTKRPTLRWIFQLLQGIHRVILNIDGQSHCIWDGLNDLRTKILRLFGKNVLTIYQISSA